jgi:NAD(P)-dependent dehydrogenase (short-subunit alcohol dehydrogenase family)
MADKTVWFITGAGRGMGADIAEAALTAGHRVFATGRNTEAVADAEKANELLAQVDAYRDPSSSLAVDKL